MRQRRFAVPITLGGALALVLLAAMAFSASEVTYRAADRDGQPVGQVLMGELVVIELRTAAGAYTPIERAEIVAERLVTAVAAGIGPADIQTVAAGSDHRVYMGQSLLVTATPAEAAAHQTTPASLASRWRDSVAAAIGPPGAQQGQAQPAQEAQAAPGEEAARAGQSLDWSGTAQKWVPIFSLESEGVYVGAAQVAGPPAQLAKVKGVAELRLDFERVARVYAYIPTATLSPTKLDRVQGVSVWATGDVRILEF